MNHCVTFIWNLFLLSPYKPSSKYWRRVGVVNCYCTFPSPAGQIFMKFCIGSLRYIKCVRATCKKLQATSRWVLHYTQLFFFFRTTCCLDIYLFIYGLYKQGVRLEACRVDWLECEKKRPWHTLRYFPDFTWNNLIKPRKPSGESVSPSRV